MLQELRTTRWALVGVVLAAFGMLAACGGGGGSGSDDGSDNDLVLVKFQLVDRAGNPTGGMGSENAYRNNMLRFTFSAPVDAATVTDRTIRIGIPSGGSLFVTAPGKFHVDGNVVTFDPTTTDTGMRPFGLLADATYSVMVNGLPDPLTIMSGEGKAVMSAFSTTFTTTDLYLPDLDQPSILSVAPTPQADIPADRFSAEAQDIWVPSAGDVQVTFSEAMNPGTFDPATSFRVVNLDRSRDVLGTFRWSEDAKTVTMRPTFGFGRGPYIIEVALSVDLTDLAGNAISNPQTWQFLTEFDPTAVNEGLVEEYFDDNLFEDTAFVPTGAAGKAAWNPATDQGMLASTFGNSTTTVPNPPGPVSGNVIPMGTGTFMNMWCQMWYRSADVGNAGTISGYKARTGTWSLAPNAICQGFTVNIGHNTASGGLTMTRAGNFVGTPVTAINNVTWTLPATMTANSLYSFPAFTTAFGYNGTDNLVVDVSKTSITLQQDWGVYSGWGSGTTRVFGYPATGTTASGSSINYTYQCALDFRTERSMAQSTWYKTESDSPMYLDPILSPTEHPPGTEAVVTFQGTADDGSGNPDPTATSVWTDDVSDLDGFEYIRFQASFKANLGTGVGPKISEIVIPYIFF